MKSVTENSLVFSWISFEMYCILKKNYLRYIIMCILKAYYSNIYIYMNVEKNEFNSFYIPKVLNGNISLWMTCTDLWNLHDAIHMYIYIIPQQTAILSRRHRSYTHMYYSYCMFSQIAHYCSWLSGPHLRKKKKILGTEIWFQWNGKRCPNFRSM